MNKFGFNNLIFKENRLLNFAGKVEKTEAVTVTPKQKAIDLLTKIHKVNPLEGGDKPESILKDNPYSFLINVLADKVYGKKYTIDKAALKKGKLIIIAGSEKIEVDNLTVAAIEWRRVDKFLTDVLKTKNISKRLIALGIEKKTPQLKALIIAIAVGPKLVDARLVDATCRSLDKLRPSLSPSTTRLRVKMKGKIDRTKAKPIKLPSKLPKKMTNKKFKEMFSDRKHDPRKQIDRLKMNIFREGRQINAQKWDFTNEAGLSKIYADFRTLGIPVNSTFYRSMFAILRQATDPSVNTYLKNKDDVKLFLDPAKYWSELDKKADLPTGFSPSAFAKAYQHLNYVKGMMLAQDKWQKLTQSKQESLDSNSIARKAKDAVTANWNKFSDAIKRRDYATAGMYVVLGWGIYKAIKESGWFGKDGKGTKYLAYTLAVGGAYIFAENAGWKPLERLGLKDLNWRVKGTPLEAIDNLLKSNPEYRELAKDLDYKVMIQASDIPLRDLEELYQQSNKKGIQFIHPNQFPKIFPRLAGLWPFKMGIGEEALGGDYAGMNKAKLSSAQREYVRVGEQLYKVALAMRAVYNETLKQDKNQPDYFRKSYEDMLKDPAINPGKVRHLLAAVHHHATITRPKRTLTSTKSIDEAAGHLKELKKYGFHLNRQIGKAGHFHGKLMGYPVVFVRSGNAYRVYLKSDYGNRFKPGPDYIAEIPIQSGPAKDLQLKKARDGVLARIRELLAPLQGTGGQKFNKPRWVNGKWECNVKLPGAAEFDIRSRKTKAYITPQADGRGLYIETEGGVAIVLDELVAKEYPVALALLPAVCAQKEYRALKAFAAVKQIRFRDKVPGDKKFTLVVAGNELQFTYDKATKKFKVDPADEKKLLQDPAFATKYVKALQDNPTFTLNRTADGIREAIKAAPQKILGYIWNKLTGQTRDPQNAGINIDLLSKSVPNYVSHTILDASIYESMQRLRRGVLGATSLADVSQMTTDQLHDTNARMQGILSMIRAENMKKSMSKWSREEWMTRVVLPLRASSSVSPRYADERAKFEYKIYQLMGPMRSDITRTPHRKAGELMNVYSYYTAHLDNHEYTYTDPSGAKKKAKIRLESLKTPPTAMYPGRVPGHLDPGLRGFYIMNYLRYVQHKVYNKAKVMGSLDHIPDGSATGHWQILEFDKWAEKYGNPNTLDPIDNKPAFKHDITKHQGSPVKYTELDKAIVREFDKAVALLMSEYKDLNYHAIYEYLRKKPGPGVNPIHVGKFRVQQRTVGGSTINVSPLWDWAGPIANLRTRSQQMIQIQRLVDNKLIKHIFDRSNRAKFFIPPVKLTTRIVRRWPWLRKFGF